MATPPNTVSRPIGAEPAYLRQICLAALHSLGEYAPEIETGDAQGLNSDLDQLSRAVTETLSGDGLQRFREGVAAALKAYQQVARRRLWTLRQKVESADAAIREFAVGIAAGQATYIKGVQEELDTLRAAARATDLQCVRRALTQACSGIRSSHAASMRAQQMVLLQLQDESRILRETLESFQRERDRDPESGAWRREHLEAEIRSRSARGEMFFVLLLSLHNLEQLQSAHPPAAIVGLFEAFFKRLAAITGKEAVIARWNPCAFAIMLPANGARAEAAGEMVQARLSGAYAVQTGGTAHHLTLELSVTVLDPRAGFANPKSDLPSKK